MWTGQGLLWTSPLREDKRAFGRRTRIGRTHIGNHDGAGFAASGQQRPHAPVEQRIVTARGIGHAVAMAERHRALAQAFQHDGVEFAAADQIDGRLQPVGGKTRSRADAERRQVQSPFKSAIPGKNRSSIDAGACFIESIFAMNRAVAKTFCGLSVKA